MYIEVFNIIKYFFYFGFFGMVILDIFFFYNLEKWDFDIYNFW